MNTNIKIFIFQILSFAFWISNCQVMDENDIKYLDSYS